MPRYDSYLPQSFNPRAREGRDAPEIRVYGADRCFNPRAREGRDTILHFIQTLIFVSIHAPARGATKSVIRLRPNSGRFNPRAREGRDQNKRYASIPPACFNPRAREGRDLAGVL